MAPLSEAGPDANGLDATPETGVGATGLDATLQDRDVLRSGARRQRPFKRLDRPLRGSPFGPSGATWHDHYCTANA
jgi:hypothetical protein